MKIGLSLLAVLSLLAAVAEDVAEAYAGTLEGFQRMRQNPPEMWRRQFACWDMDPEREYTLEECLAIYEKGAAALLADDAVLPDFDQHWVLRNLARLYAVYAQQEQLTSPEALLARFFDGRDDALVRDLLEAADREAEPEFGYGLVAMLAASKDPLLMSDRIDAMVEAAVAANPAKCLAVWLLYAANRTAAGECFLDLHAEEFTGAIGELDREWKAVLAVNILGREVFTDADSATLEARLAKNPIWPHLLPHLNGLEVGMWLSEHGTTISYQWTGAEAPVSIQINGTR